MQRNLASLGSVVPKQRAEDRGYLLPHDVINSAQIVQKPTAIHRANQLALHPAGCVEAGVAARLDLNMERQPSIGRRERRNDHEGKPWTERSGRSEYERRSIRRRFAGERIAEVK